MVLLVVAGCSRQADQSNANASDSPAREVDSRKSADSADSATRAETAPPREKESPMAEQASTGEKDEGSDSERTASPAEGAEAALPDFTCKLSAPEAFTVGEAAQVTFTLKNPTDKAWKILTWYSPLEGIEANLFQVTREGEEVEYLGRLLKRGNPPASAYLTLGPKSSTAVRLNLAKAYDLGKPGEYTVSFDGYLNDVCPAEVEVPRPQSECQIVSLQAEPLRFKVLPKD
jgi:hypothetical protein